MSSCANVVNRLQSDVCLLKDNWSNIELMAAILKIDQAIFLQSPLLVYLVPTNPNGMGVPLTIEASSPSALTTTTYSGLIVLEPYENDNCVVFTTETFLNFGQRTPTGFFEMTETLPIVVIDANPSILLTLSYSDVVSALQSCAGSSDNHTVNCEAYNALLVFLKKNYGVRNITPSVAACFYDYFNQYSNQTVEPVSKKEEQVVYLPVDEKLKLEISIVLEPSQFDETSISTSTTSVVLPKHNDENSISTSSANVVLTSTIEDKHSTVVLTSTVEDKHSTVENKHSTVEIQTFEETSVRSIVLPPASVDESFKERSISELYTVYEERAFPFEPFEPFEPSRELSNSDKSIKSEEFRPIVRHIEDSATNTISTTESSSNDAIEAKLRALLEATETSEVSRTE
jgi:hypothetical protein